MLCNVIGDAAKQALSDVQGKNEKPQDKGATRKRHRWPLGRSLWHALKSLVTNDPRAALSAAGAGTAYAIKGAAEGVSRKLADDPENKRAEPTYDEKAEFVEAFRPLNARALAELKQTKTS